MGFLDPTGILDDLKGAKKASRDQVAAINRQIDLETKQTNYQAEALAAQMAQTQARMIAQEYAEKLLSKPIDKVDVTLGTSDLDIATDNLLGRRKATRQTYRQEIPQTQQSRVTALL